MKRLFSMAFGAALGILVARKLSRAVHAWTPRGLAERSAGLGVAARSFADEVRIGAKLREAELRERLNLDDFDEQGDRR